MEAVAPPVLGEVPEFTLLDQRGRQVSRDDLAGRPWVADFVFTRCALSCPLMTSRMLLLGERMQPGAARRVSVSVDPDHDRPAVLAAYAESYGIGDPGWLFLTGERDAIHALVVGGFRLAVDDEPPPGTVPAGEPILHSTRFVLVDAGGRIRGYYDAVSDEGLDRLLRDLGSL